MIEDMTAYDVCAGLMRGDRLDARSGFAAESAALIAADCKRLGARDTRNLIDWAVGFADGLTDAMHYADPSIPSPPVRMALRKSKHYKAGREAGGDEEGFLVFPTTMLRDRRAS